MTSPPLPPDEPLPDEPLPDDPDEPELKPDELPELLELPGSSRGYRLA